MKKWIAITGISLAFLAACDDAKKEAAEAAAASASAATAEAEKAAADASKKAAEEAEKAFGEKKVAVVKGLQSQVDAFDRKLAYLKDKAGKLKAAPKKAADTALEAVEKARADVTTSLKDVDGAGADTLTTLTEKVSASLGAAQKAMDSLETAVTGKK